MNQLRRSLILLPFVVFLSSAQEVNWSATRFSITAQWLVAQREFGHYWENGPGIGVLSEIPLNETFSFVGLGSFSWHAPSGTARESKIPRVLLFKLGLGLEARLPQGSFAEPSVGAALVNNMFIFTGPASPNDIDNSVESEFGAALFSRLDLNIDGLPRFGFMIAYDPIFTGPDPVATFSVAAAIELF